MKRKQPQKRSESLKLHKPSTLQLPRFYSKQKNIVTEEIKSEAGDSECKSSKNSSKNERVNLTRNKIAEIVDKIKEEKDKNISVRNKNTNHPKQKKITAANLPHSCKNSHLRVSIKSDRQNLDYQSVYGAKLAHQRKLTTEKGNEGTPAAINMKQFRSKSLKNAVKIGANQQSIFLDEGKKSEWKTERNKKMSTESTKNRNQAERNKISFKTKRETIRGTKPKQISREKVNLLLQIPTETTQPNPDLFCDIQRNLWNRQVEIFQKVCKNLKILEWPEQFIVMEKFNLEKKFYGILEAYKQMKFKQKYKKHICITRIVVYMHANLIVNEMDNQFLSPIFQNIRNSYIKILEAVHRMVESGSIPNELHFVLSKNNEASLKHLQKVLTRKSLPFRNLLQNMLESSLKIESFEFIEILDKTLKWELLKMPSYPYLPAPQKQMFLVLDLDETLIHYSYEDEVFHVRPFTEQFLKKASQHFEVIVFTAAIQEYADQIITEIDPDHSVSYKLYRNHLTYLNGVAIKDLSMLGRPLNKTIIVDNIPNNFRLQPQNGIHIRSWYCDDDDDILGKLYALLMKIVNNHSHDLREGIREYGSFIKEQITKPQLIYELKAQL